MNLSEINWDLEAVGTWPVPVKLAVIVVVCLAVGGAWFYLDTQDQLAQLEQARSREQELKNTLAVKQKKAANLEEYKQLLQEMERTFGDLVRQLPNKAEVPELLVDVSQTGLAAGLSFELFQPQEEIKKEFYAELPIKIRVAGKYEQLGTFVSGLASLPRIVTVHDVAIEPIKNSSKLSMSAWLRTYRYLDEEEVAQAAQPQARR